jgi:hypothetical protein
MATAFAEGSAYHLPSAMPSQPRLQAIERILSRPPVAVAPAAGLDELWACDVFTLDRMKSALPKAVFKSIQRSIKQGSKLDTSVADMVAQAMKDWATSRGALYYAHVFYPLTNLTAARRSPNSPASCWCRGNRMAPPSPTAASAPPSRPAVTPPGM